MKFNSLKFALALAVGHLVYALIPLICTVARIPDTLVIETDSEVAYSTQVGYVQTDGTIRQHAQCPQEERFVPIYLPVDDPNRDKLCFGFCGANGRLLIKAVKLFKWYVIPYELDKDSLNHDYVVSGGITTEGEKDGSIVVRVKEDGYFCPKNSNAPKWSFCYNRLIISGIIGLEVLILVLALISATRKKQENLIDCLKTSLLVSGFLALFLCIVLPIQSFLVNRVSFSYGLDSLLSELLLGFTCWLVVGTLILALFSYCFGRWICAAIMGLTVYFYFATGIMAFGLPALDGDFRYFAADRFRQKLDLIVLFMCVGGFSLAARWVLPVARWIVLGFSVMFIASLFDVKVESKPLSSHSIGGNFCSFEDVIKSGYYSDKANVIILILDSVSTEMADSAITEDLGIAQSLNGFTLYMNNIGMHNVTALGVPGIFTGNFLEDLHRLNEHGSSISGNESFLTSYASRKIPAFILLDVVPNFHWTNCLGVKDSKDIKDNVAKRKIFTRINSLQAWNLFEIVRFRMTPFRFKYQMAFLTMKDWPMFDRGSSETRLYPSLARYPVGDEKMTLHVYHTEGCHFPFQVGKHGERLPEPLQNYEGMYNKTFFAFTNLAKLFAALKEKGVYDNSTIIVTADHGANHTMHEVPVVDGMAYEASKPFPMLLVKPAKANGELRYSYIPTSHTKIAPYVCALLNDDTINAEDYLRATNRMYRDFNPAIFSRHDYYFDDEGKCVKVESTK